MTRNDPPDDRPPGRPYTAQEPIPKEGLLADFDTEFDGEDLQRGHAECEVCGRAIPVNRTRCQKHSTQSRSSDSDSSHKWVFDTVSIALVKGGTKYIALANAGVAFRFRSERLGPESFDLIHDLDDSETLSKTYTRNWGGDLTAAAQLHSDTGQQLLEQGIENTEWGGPMAIEKTLGVEDSPLDSSEPRIYLQDGDGLTSKDELDEILLNIEDSDEQFWVVPAVLYHRQRNTDDKAVQYDHCSACDTRRKHVFGHYDGGHPDFNPNGKAVWYCLTCDSATEGPAPKKDGIDDVSHPDYQGPGRYTRDDLEARQHEKVLSKLEERGELE